MKFAVLASTNGTDLGALIKRVDELQAELSLVVVDRECGALDKAQEAGIPHSILPKIEQREQRDQLLHNILSSYDIDVVVLIGYMRLLSPWFVNRWKNKIMNIHPSLLPAFAGGMDTDVHVEVLKRGCKLTGCTLHYVDEGADTGPIILQRVVDVKEDDTLVSLKQRVQRAEQDILIEGINLHAKNLIQVQGDKVVRVSVVDNAPREIIRSSGGHDFVKRTITDEETDEKITEEQAESTQIISTLGGHDFVRREVEQPAQEEKNGVVQPLEHKLEVVLISSFSQEQLKSFLKDNNLSLTQEEVQKIVQKIGRNPTLTELHIFNIEWSEHCSYKSSKTLLKQLPTQGPHVILGPSEDAGIVHVATINGEKVGLVMKHESHNHPSQVVPFEGAATGIGGVVRDIACMGAKVIGIADALRFGNPKGKNERRVKYVAGSVIDGIAGYANPLGIPNLGGDIYLNSSFDDNCLVNVVGLGILKESDIIHSSTPKNSSGYDVILVGKATDHSGFGGAAFASVILDNQDQNKGAVQVPDPFLKNVLLRSTYKVFEEVKKRGIDVGFKDCGAGGVMCASSELGSAGGLGMSIDLDKIHTAMDLPSFVSACSETQERFVWVVPKEFSKILLDIYNKEFDLPSIAQGAQASIIGEVRSDQRYVLTSKGKIVCDLPIQEVTEGIGYEREAQAPRKELLQEVHVAQPSDYGQAILDILSHPDVACKAQAYKHYDTEVQGNALIRPGEADAGVVVPLAENPLGIALSVDCNPRYTRIDPYLGAAHAVAESMRNVAAVGATPWALTDCLNFGNPEKPESFWQFKEAIRGLSDAARGIKIKQFGTPTPFISGNVSFYNESSSGASVDPSPIVACSGILQDYTKAITPTLKKAGSTLLLIGSRTSSLGGSVWYDLHEKLGQKLPSLDLAEHENMIYAVIDSIDKKLALSCHDISDGGLITTVCEMVIGSRLGASLFVTHSLRGDEYFFCEKGGFVLEVSQENLDAIHTICTGYGVQVHVIGQVTTDPKVEVSYNGAGVVSLSTQDIARAWSEGFRRQLE